VRDILRQAHQEVKKSKVSQRTGGRLDKQEETMFIHLARAFEDGRGRTGRMMTIGEDKVEGEGEKVPTSRGAPLERIQWKP